MALGRLDIHAVRNLMRVSLPELRPINLFFGANGSGKTSVLEGVHILATARSFRDTRIRPVINHGAQCCVLYGEVSRGKRRRIAIGVQRDRGGGLAAKVAGQPIHSLATLVEQLPVQVINSQSFDLLTGSPEARRRYLDWGVFHVEQEYHGVWRRFQRGMKQRNSLLRRDRIPATDLAPWNQEFVEAGERVDAMRSGYLERLRPRFVAMLERLAPELATLEIHHRRGWAASATLGEALAASERADREQGFTHVGPQRSDLKLLSDGHDAGLTLSRGQQKMVVCALKLAQAQVLEERREESCVYLVDDLSSELDGEHCRRVCEALTGLKSQIFLTCVEGATIRRHLGRATTVFHVEHGAVREGE